MRPVAPLAAAAALLRAAGIDAGEVNWAHFPPGECVLCVDSAKEADARAVLREGGWFAESEGTLPSGTGSLAFLDVWPAVPAGGTGAV